MISSLLRQIALRLIPKQVFYWMEELFAFHLKIKYQSFYLFVNSGNSLIIRLNKDKSELYEPEITKKIIGYLKKGDKILDVGANIGLISLNLIKHFDRQIDIFCFEPGPNQYYFLNKTIQANGLEQHVKISPIALGVKDEVLTFHTHSSRHNSGDGFIDTGRAGLSKKVPVTSKKLDSWWDQNGRPKISLVKIDTEGAELWVLQGGKNFFQSNRPIIFFELWPENIKNYPYTEMDLLNYLVSMNYSIQTITDETIDKNNIHLWLGKDEMFIAVPNPI